MKQIALLLIAITCATFASLSLTTQATDKSSEGWIDIFAGEDLDGWQQKTTGEWAVVSAVPLDSADPKKFAPQPGRGVMVNGKGGRDSNIFSTAQHGDIEAHIEFTVPKGSNSGVYFQGRYEVQVFDSYGRDKVKHSDCGGIYQRYNEKKSYGFEGHAPRVNASKAPGEWQTFDVIFRAPRFDANGKKTEDARFIKVVHNGKVVHENVSTTGPTRAAAYEDEKPQGPLMLQGDHGPVAYRNVRIRRVKLK